MQEPSARAIEMYLLNVLKVIIRRKSRTALTALSVCIGVLSLFLISAASDTGTSILYSELDGMGINGISVTKSSDEKELDQNDLELIECIAGVDSATPLIVNNCVVQRKSVSGKSLAWGIDCGSDQIISIEITQGRLFSIEDVKRAKFVCILDSDTAKEIFGREEIIGESISVNMNGTYMDYEIIGIAKAGSNLLDGVVMDYLPYVIYFPYSNIQRETGTVSFNEIAVNISENSTSEAVSKRISNTLAPNGDNDSVICKDLSGQRKRLENIVLIVKLLLSVIGGVSLIVAGIGNTTAMISSVRERTREIGIKKSIGAKRKNIIGEFLAESLTVTFIGCALGALVFILLINVVGIFVNFKLTIDIKTFLGVVLITAAVGVVSGIYPAIKASNLRPVDAFSAL